VGAVKNINAMQSLSPSPLVGEGHARAAGEGEGSAFDFSSRFQRTQNRFQNSIRIAQNIIIPESQYGKTLRFKPLGSDSILRHSLQMLSAIDFNNQMALEANKIDDIRTKRLLALELECL
jgi:hypothetical protein